MSPKTNALFPHEAGIDNKSLNFLVNALEKQASGDFDYLKFRQSVQALQHLDLDPKTALKSAFVTASTMGLTREKLLQTAGNYKKVLSVEKEQFDLALEKQINDRIESRKKESAQLLDIIDQYKQKIAELEEKIRSFEAKIAATDSDIQDAEERILSSRQKFEVAYSFLQEAIEQDIQMIQESL